MIGEGSIETQHVLFPLMFLSFALCLKDSIYFLCSFFSLNTISVSDWKKRKKVLLFVAYLRDMLEKTFFISLFCC